MKIEERLCFNHCYLVGISCKGVDVKFTSSCLEVDIAERLEAAGFQPRKFNKDTTILGKALEVEMTLPVQVATHLFDLEISHIAYAFAQSAFMRFWPAELKPLNQTAFWEHLSGSAYNFTKASLACENTDDMSTAGNPDNSFVFFRF